MDNCYPFLALELKSEAAGGTFLYAERQAAGSFASCVNSMHWLLEEAYPSQTESDHSFKENSNIAPRVPDNLIT